MNIDTRVTSHFDWFVANGQNTLQNTKNRKKLDQNHAIISDSYDCYIYIIIYIYSQLFI